MTFVDYQQLSPMQKFGYQLKRFFKNLPGAFGRFLKAIGRGIVNFFKAIVTGFKNPALKITAPPL